MAIRLAYLNFDLADIGMMAGLLALVLGLWMGGRQHRQRWDVEEAVKNEKITEEQARRRIAWITWRPIGFIGLGVALVLAGIATLRR